MKKKIVIAIIVVIILLGSLTLFKKVFKENDSKKIREFSLKEYQEYVVNNKSTETVNKITNTETLLKETEALWKKIYGEQVEDKKPYLIFYDDKEEVWLIEGTLPENVIGGVPHSIIKSNGEVLAIWHGK